MKFKLQSFDPTMAEPADPRPDLPLAELPRLERQILDAVYRLGEAGVSEIERSIALDSSYDSVRVTLGKLEKRGLVAHRREGNRYVYRPTVPSDDARRSALGHVLKTFFSGDPSEAIVTLLDMSASRLSPDDLEAISAIVDEERTGDEPEEGST